MYLGLRSNTNNVNDTMPNATTHNTRKCRRRRPSSQSIKGSNIFSKEATTPISQHSLSLTTINTKPNVNCISIEHGGVSSPVLRVLGDFHKLVGIDEQQWRRQDEQDEPWQWQAQQKFRLRR